VNKQQFLKIIQDQNSLKKEDISQIEELEDKYPYSQIVRILSALGTRKFKQPEANKKLTTAAVYATDRMLLKKILTTQQPRTEVKENGSPAPTKINTEAPKQELTKKPTAQPVVTTSPAKDTLQPASPSPIVHKAADHPGLLSEDEAEKLRTDVMKNLEDLMEIKKLFLDGFSEAKTKSKSKSKSTKAKKTKTKSSRIKNELKQDTTKSSRSKPQSSTAPKKTKGSTSKESIKKLRVTKPTLKSEVGKPVKKKVSKINKEQQVLIDKFIKKEPSIKKNKGDKATEHSDDLSKSSVSFGEDLVSENLARVMIKQGKMNKAIDIYKKLIWKFPQKKAYFASQIESLKGK